MSINVLYTKTNFLNFNSILTKCPLCVANFSKNSFRCPHCLKVLSSERQCQEVPLSITDMFVIYSITKKMCLFNKNYFSLWSMTNLSVIVMQECFVINCGKGCLCDGCLWLFTDESQQRPKLITIKCQEIP